MERGVNINTNRRKFFQQFLRVLRPTLKPYLSNGEMNVLGEILYFNDKYKDIKEDLRKKLIFDYDTKAEIMENLSISANTLANNLTSLRKKAYLDNKTIRKGLDICPKDEFIMKYTFKIHGVEDK